MIRVHCRPLAETRTANTTCAWVAECEVDGRRFEARSRHGAANALARELVAAALPDDGLEVRYEGLAGSLRYRSFRAAAGWTFVESAATPLRRAPFREFEKASEGVETVSPGDGRCVTSPAAGSLDSGSGDCSVFDGSAKGLNPTPIPGGARRRCITCGREFRPRRPWATFCSGRCRVAGHRRGKLADGYSGAKPRPEATAKAA